jgi:hypothetical protein
MDTVTPTSTNPLRGTWPSSTWASADRPVGHSWFKDLETVCGTRARLDLVRWSVVRETGDSADDTYAFRPSDGRGLVGPADLAPPAVHAVSDLPGPRLHRMGR